MDNPLKVYEAVQRKLLGNMAALAEVLAERARRFKDEPPTPAEVDRLLTLNNCVGVKMMEFLPGLTPFDVLYIRDGKPMYTFTPYDAPRMGAGPANTGHVPTKTEFDPDA